MAENVRDYNRDLLRKVLLGCGPPVLLIALSLGALLSTAFLNERTASRYPGADILTSHSNYTGLPFQFRWDNSYHSRDSFTDIYNWYSTTFALGAEARANGSCILLDGARKRLAWTRYTSVVLCDTDNGRLIYVTRSTSFP